MTREVRIRLLKQSFTRDSEKQVTGPRVKLERLIDSTTGDEIVRQARWIQDAIGRKGLNRLHLMGPIP